MKIIDPKEPIGVRNEHAVERLVTDRSTEPDPHESRPTKNHAQVRSNKGVAMEELEPEKPRILGTNAVLEFIESEVDAKIRRNRLSIHERVVRVRDRIVPGEVQGV